jgi:hypothetical protein
VIISPRFIFLATLLTAVVMGILARFFQLGASPLAIDEYFIAQSVTNILDRGIPQFSCGGIYTRGIIQQYLTAGLMLLGVDIHVGLRSITAVSNLLAFPAVYLLGKEIGGKRVATISLILFALSIWEIEMARFGRMYAPFQAIFLWYCFALFKAYTGSTRYFLIAVGLGTFASFVYEGGALLLCTSFIPLLAGRIREVWSWPVTGGSLILGTWYITADFRPAGAIPKLSDEYYQRLEPLLSSQSASSAGSPLQLSFGLAEYLMLVGALAVSIWYFLNLRKTVKDWGGCKTDWIAYAWIGLSIWLGFAGLFGTILTLTTALVLWRWLRFGHINNRGSLAVGAWLVVSLVTWTILVFSHSDGGAASRISETIYALFLFPDLYSEVGYRWIRSVPVITIALLTLTPYYLFLTRSTDGTGNEIGLFRFLAGLFVVLAFAVAILPQQYSTIRYTYFIHPLAILLVAGSLAAIARQVLSHNVSRDLALLASTFALMAFSTDYSFSHMINITDPTTMFRTEMSKWDRDKFYRRWDYRSPAEYVNTPVGPLLS